MTTMFKKWFKTIEQEGDISLFYFFNISKLAGRVVNAKAGLTRMVK